MTSRFELFVVLRNQVADRRIVRRAVAVEAGMEELAGAVGGDPVMWGLAGLGAEIDAQLTEKNPDRRGYVAEELLLAENVPAGVAAAVRERLRSAPEAMSVVAAALVVAEAIVDLVYGEIEAGEGLESIDAAGLGHRIRRTGGRTVDCLTRAGLDGEDAAGRVLAGMRRVREDLKL